MTDTAANRREIRIWDLPTRLFHWALVLLVALSFVTGEFGGLNFTMPAWLPGGGGMVANMTVHMWSGFSVLTLVLFRIAWGVIGSTTARFGSFVRGPAAVVAYLRGLAGRGPVAFVAGHNPAGAAMVVAALALLLVQAGTGLFLKEDDFFGIAAPLHDRVSEATAKTLTRVHHFNWTLIEILVIVHVLANLYYWLVKRENLIAAMVTGRRPLPPGTPAPILAFAPGILAVGVLAAAAAAVWAVVAIGGN